MGVIAEAVEKLVAEYIRDKGLVLWFDPEKDYDGIVHTLDAGQERLLVFDGSFYKLRLEAEPWLRGFDPPKLLVYLPISYEEAREPLAEMLVLGTDLRPGLSGNRNTRLAVVARKALKGRIAETRLADLDRQIEQGGLVLSELERLVTDSGDGTLPTALTVHFGTSLVDEAALTFLAQPEHDAELVERNGISDWARALELRYGLNAEKQTLPATLRTLLARQVLTCDLLEALGADFPEPLQRVITAREPGITSRAGELARQWRNRRDIAASYLPAAAETARALHLDSIEFTDKALKKTQTFLSLEQRLVRRVAARVATDFNSAAIAESRLAGFWSEQDQQLQTEWTLVWQAASLFARASAIERVLQGEDSLWPEMVRRYTGDPNWSELDTLHRRFERRASSLEFALTSNPAPEVEQLVHAVRRRHQEVSGAVAECFLRAWRKENFSIKGHVRQTEIFDRYVAPELANRRTAYVLVDALRWELARELPDVLGRDFETKIELAIGTAPSITEVGMAALLPSAASGLEIGGAGKLQVSLHGHVLKNRADRIEYLKDRSGIPVIDLRLEEPRAFRRKLKEIAGPALIIVTSREIDQSGEDETTAAREHMERVLTHLGLALRKLAEDGVEHIVVTADHGYLYGEELAESEKIDPPGGKTVLSHRRVWAGHGGAASDHYLLTEVSRFGAISDLEMAVPWNLAGFRASGPTAYFHGGLSPQEILLPVILVTPRSVTGSMEAKKLMWDVSLGSTKITTRFLSVRIQARAQGLFAESWPSVRVEVRIGNEVCAMPVSGSYGFQEDTGTVALRSLGSDEQLSEVNTVALMLTSKAPSRGTVSIHLVDAATGVELKKLDQVEVSLAI